ncbi:MAG: 4-hydroxythreonine-4-phosphate dehydrogenase PdxA [Streptosporangiales bacterium]|nr:4-hydroxythreonine-4-phosphate dehydrogenase PdxA [Streptosporangiales bacterium]
MTTPLIGLTMGDPAGIGPEITVKALADPATRGRARTLLLADVGVVEQAVEVAGVDLTVRRVAGPEEVTDDPARIDVLDLATVGSVEFGQVAAAYGKAAVASIELACALARERRIDAIVTAPISKEAIRAAGSPFPGHTEMLAELFGVPGDRVVTAFVLDQLRIFFLTRHHSLRDLVDLLHTGLVLRGLRRVDELLVDLGIERPKIALAALNPHAGENGLLGSEEREILEPAVRAARDEGIDATGPVPADAVFYQARHGRYDGVLSLYHDQGHIAAKTLDFFGTVSCTLGLPVIRTSVDHGTAFDIAGRGVADASGQVAAIRVAAELVPTVRHG